MKNKYGFTALDYVLVALMVLSAVGAIYCLVELLSIGNRIVY